jgi:uncharacterized protein YciI
MFVISSTYARPLDDKALVTEHLEFIKQCFASGLFVAAGGRPGSVGGVIIARGTSEDELRGVMQKDPFVREGVVTDYHFMAFRSSMAAYDDLIES